MISPISGTYSTKQTSKQNTARVIEKKNKLTVIRGEWGEGQWRKIGEGLSKNMYKGHMDKARAGRVDGGGWGWEWREWEGWWGENGDICT